MCGISGFWTRPSDGADAMKRIARQMSDSVAHRGPDGDGVWLEADAGMGLSHRRLSIVDLSDAACQPMISMTGRHVLSFNGEFYNFRDIARELVALGSRVNVSSDTAVFLAAVETWGLVPALQRFNGMYAFALWDRKERRLSLVRDRVGIKPLYVYHHEGNLIFGSELKALRAHPAFTTTIDSTAVEAYLRYRYVPAPRTIYRNTFKLMAGHVLTISSPTGELPAAVPFWSAVGAARAGVANPFVGSDSEAETALDDLLNDAVGQHMVSDVPVGAFLSGGIDSSVVVAMMRSHTTTPVKTFTLGFNDASFDEAKDAAAVARHLGTDHTELYVGDEDVRNVVPMLADMFDEPFADPSQVPTYLVSALARKRVTVSLSGDGGDELFGGYTRYQWVPRTWNRLARMPAGMRRASLGAIRALSPAAINSLVDPMQSLLPRHMRQRQVGDKLHKLAANVSVSSADDLFQTVASAHQDPASLLRGKTQNVDHLFAVLRTLPALDPASRMMLADILTYLPDDILAKVDRCSMAVALESRVPILDHRVVEFAWRIPVHMKIRNEQGKWLLRQVLGRYVPPVLFERPKTGFDLPIAQWLRGPLRAWAGDLLDPVSLRAAGLFNPERVSTLFAEHLSGRRNNRDILWALLMFETWRNRWAPVTV